MNLNKENAPRSRQRRPRGAFSLNGGEEYHSARAIAWRKSRVSEKISFL